MRDERHVAEARQPLEDLLHLELAAGVAHVEAAGGGRPGGVGVRVHQPEGPLRRGHAGRRHRRLRVALVLGALAERVDAALERQRRRLGARQLEAAGRDPVEGPERDLDPHALDLQAAVADHRVVGPQDALHGGGAIRRLVAGARRVGLVELLARVRREDLLQEDHVGIERADLRAHVVLVALVAEAQRVVGLGVVGVPDVVREDAELQLVRIVPAAAGPRQRAQRTQHRQPRPCRMHPLHRWSPVRDRPGQSRLPDAS